MNCHQTADCPHCGKDSWQSTWEATFTTVECMWCNGKFKYNPGEGSVKVSNSKPKNRKGKNEN